MYVNDPSVFSTNTATDTPMWITGVIYANGLRGLWYTFFTAWTAVGAFVSARIFRRSLAYTQAEWQSLRFGGLGAEMLRGWMAGWQVFMNMFILGWVGIAMGKVCALAFDWPVWVGLVVPSVITAIYTLAAGYWGVVMGDFLQGIVAVFAIVVVSLVGVAAAGGPAAIAERLSGLGEAWRLDPLAFTGWAGGEFPALWWLTMLVIAVIGGFGMGTSIDWYVEAQRIHAEPRERTVSQRPVDMAIALDHGEVEHPAQEPPGDARRAPAAPGDLDGPFPVDLDAEDPGRALDDDGHGSHTGGVAPTLRLTLNRAPGRTGSCPRATGRRPSPRRRRWW